MKSFRLVVLILVISYGVCDDSESVQVKTKHGVLIGKVERTFLKAKNYYSFKGIPYAQAPVGKLRFKPPVPHHGWEESYAAYENKPTCIQHSSRSRMAEPYGISGSEDCLYINIFTSNLEDNAPVIVFDYNDNFRTGFNGTNTYSPDFLIEENVIVATISHRLGLFGYLSTMDDVIPPNNGVKDYILGLQWIKENINTFGGDPQRVTLMGIRGGAVMADILLHTEKAKDLFSGAIMQSGTALEAVFFARNLKQTTFKFASLFNITSESSEVLLEELQKIDAIVLSSKDNDVLDVEEMMNSQMSIFPFAPVIENSNVDGVITSLPENSKIVNDVPIMIGMNSREGLDLTAHYLFDPRLVGNVGDDFFFLFPVRANFKFDTNSDIYKEVLKEIKEFYLKEGILYYANILEYAVYMGDLLQNYALNQAAKTLSVKSQSPVYYYMFDFRGSLNENMKHLTRYSPLSLETWGATVLDEICYLHLCTRIKNSYSELLKLLSEQHEIKVLKKMVRLWANFAKTRNPTPIDDDDILKDFKWKPVEKGNEKTNYLHITKTLRMKANPLDKREQFWNDFLAKYSQLAIDGIVQKKETHDEL